ncbi:hypothetical protein ACHAXT_006024 [Thalassiosira profunda]
MRAPVHRLLLLLPVALALSPDVDDVLSSQLIEWLRSNGAYINPKLSVARAAPADPSSPRGVFATAALDEGETVCKIPWSLVIGPSAALSSKQQRRDSDCGTIRAVKDAMAAGDATTPYGRYLRAQPRNATPGFWSDAAKKYLEEMVDSARAEADHLTEYDELPPHGIDEFDADELRCPDDMRDPLWRHAAMLVKMRGDFEFMVPFYDMMNHHNRLANAKHRYNPYNRDEAIGIEQTGYEIVTTKSIAPGRWLIDFARVKFEIDWLDGDASTGELAAKFLVPPSETGVNMLRAEVARLEAFAAEERDADYAALGISQSEWHSLWQYFDALLRALSLAVNSEATLTEDVWNRGDDWWVQDGSLVAADEDEHWVLPIKRDPPTCSTE